MNRTELIEKITSRCLGKIAKEYIKQILEEELPDFQRIDWVRLRDCFEKVSDGYMSSPLFAAVNIYNINLPPALKPLPKEMPKEFHREYSYNHSDDLWHWIVSRFGIPESKPALPSVEELTEVIKVAWRKAPAGDNMFKIIAKDLHDTYALHPREWWQDCERFINKGTSYKKYSHQVYPDGRTFLHSELSRHDLQDCTPYTEPTADDIIKKHNLTEEEIKIIKQS